MVVAAAALLVAASPWPTPAFWVGVVVGLVLAQVVAVAWSLTRRRRRRAQQAAHTTARDRPRVDATPVRRPLYLDRSLLNDLLAHAEPRDFGKGLRATLADDDLHGSAGDTRLLNKVIAGLRRQRHLIDLDLDRQAPLATGRVVLVTGQLEEHELSRLSASSASDEDTGHAGNGHGGRDGPRAVAAGALGTRERTRRRSAPLVLSLHDDVTGRTYVGVVETRRLRSEGRAWMAGPVSVLAVVDAVLGSTQRVPAARVLGEHVRGPLPPDADEVSGPGAIVSIAALYR